MYPEMISICQQLLDGATVKKTETIKIYTPSIRFSRDGVCFLARMEGEKALWSAGGELPALFYGKLVQQEPLPVKKSPLDVENAQVLLSLFPELRPGSHQGKAFTMGFGDRLGLATPGQLRAIRDTEVFPVLAQQSMRELELTGRTYDDVFAAAVYGVLETGWNRGWGPMAII